MSYQRTAVPDLGRIFDGETISGLSEWQLLERYLERRDEIAFEALVARHGPMVLGVCRRMLAGQAEVEDAFQATFLVLVRRARQLGPADALGPWLYGVAARVSLRARSAAARHRRLATAVGQASPAIFEPMSIDRELSEILDQELTRLPAKYRSPLVLCYLEGQTHEEAAQRLQWPLGTVKGRLARARDLLRSRLTRRGVAPTVLAVTTALTRESSAAVGPELLERTVKASLRLAFGQATTQVVSTSIASLVEGVMTSMFLSKFKWAGLAILISGLTFTGAVAFGRQGGGFGGDRARGVKVPPLRSAAGTVPDESKSKPDPSASLESGSVKSGEGSAIRIELQKQFLNAAQREWAALFEDFKQNHTALESVYESSKRLMKAESEVHESSSARGHVEGHLDRIRELARFQHANPSATKVQLAQIDAYAAEAALWTAEAEASEPDKPSTGRGDAKATPGSASAAGRDPQSRRIIAALDELVVMKFAEETTLEDVLKHIQEKTKSPGLPKGIAIYVDPVGLSQADKTMTSTVRNLDLEGVPLRRTLQLALAQLDLVYFVEDGMLFITSQEAGAEPLPPARTEPSLLKRKLDQALRGELDLKEMKDVAEKLKAYNEIVKARDAAAKDQQGAGRLQ